jgi:electron transfer flavoprotein beta subunit
VEEIESITDNKIIAKRRLDKGVETLSSTLPCLMTVHESSPHCRSREAKRVMQYKYARTQTELNSKSSSSELIQELHIKRPYLTIPEWGVEDIGAEMEKIGLAGSPTKVKSVESIVLTSDENKVLKDTDDDIELMIKELIENHTIG